MDLLRIKVSNALSDTVELPVDSLSSPGSEITSKLNSDNCNVLNKPVVMYQMQLDLSTGIFKKIECLLL